VETVKRLEKNQGAGKANAMVGENDADDSEEGGTDDARARYDECAVEMKSLRSGAGEAVNDHGSAEDDLICS